MNDTCPHDWPDKADCQVCSAETPALQACPKCEADGEWDAQERVWQCWTIGCKVLTFGGLP